MALGVRHCVVVGPRRTHRQCPNNRGGHPPEILPSDIEASPLEGQASWPLADGQTMKHAFKKILRTLLIGLMLTINGSMARGQSLNEKCVINRAVSPDEVIASCTAKIRSGAESGERLAYVLAIRARAYRFKKDDNKT